MHIDKKISEYYDNQMNDYDLLHFEAKMALRNELSEYTNKKCYEFFKITNSIKLVRNRAYEKSNLLIYELIKRPEKSFININAVRFKRFYKHFRNRILNILRNNS